MKYPLLVALLGVSEIAFKAGFFGGKPFVSVTNEQLDIIENALAKNDTSAFTEQLEELNAQKQKIESAVVEALQINALEAAGTIEESISLLGTTCKEYGAKSSVHTLVNQNGHETNLEDGFIDGYLDPNDEHNKLLKEF